MSAPTLVRLQRFIAQAGIAARRKAEDLITSGRVTVDGKVVTELGTKVDPLHANVQVDGAPVAPQDLFYVVFNKPKGCITAVTDDRGRETVMDYLPNLPVSVAPVGRLDFYSEGVLLLTNDGELAAKLLAPSSHVPKTYHVKVNGRVGPAELDRLRTGVTLDDGTVTAPAEVEVLPGDSKHPWLAFTLYEGKSRQIHRMLEALGASVTKLQRVAFANLSFHGLRVGDARELSQGELNELRETVGLDRKAGARGRWSATREDTDSARRQRAQAQAERDAAAGIIPAPSGDDGDGDGDDEAVFERQLAARTRGGDRPMRAPSSDRPPARGGFEGRPARGPSSDRPAPSRGAPAARGGFGDRPSRGPSSDRPSRGAPAARGGFGDRPARGPSSDRPSRGAPPSRGGFGDRPARGPSSDRPAPSRGAPPSRGGFGDRPSRGPSSDRPSRGAPPSRGGFGDRPSRGPSSDRPPARGGFGDRPARGPSSDRPPARGGFGDRPSRGAPSDRPSRGAPSDRPSRGAPSDRPSRGAPPSRGGFGDRPSRGAPSDRPARAGAPAPRPASPRPPSRTGARPSGGGRPDGTGGRAGGGGRAAPRGKPGGRR